MRDKIAYLEVEQMAKAITKPQVSVSIQIQIDEVEAAALIDLAGYGVNQFIEAFYEKLGRSYMQKHEAGLRRFLETITAEVSPAVIQAQAVRELLAGK